MKARNDMLKETTLKYFRKKGREEVTWQDNKEDWKKRVVGKVRRSKLSFVLVTYFGGFI